MPLNCEALPPRSRHEFCLALKAARERKGLSLSTIAAATKIPASLFAGLERNDLRYWPTGLYRRSFFRDYVRMLELPESDVCAEFAQLFSDDDGCTSASASLDETRPTELRLILDTAWHPPRPPAVARLKTAVADIIAVLVAAAAIAWIAGLDRGTTAALVSMAYFSLATMLLGESPAKWVLSRRPPIASSRSTADASATLPHQDEGANAPVPPARPAAWISDARRVGPPPQLRFRIKESS